ncbi:MAG: RNA polymerase sigma factor [Candidatus Kapabacteria bacterium]|nr:RNA polymerase sigma factor [Ignavibacteriota bacterium]MCW5885556.1 RNA polymerase sigma factor [Candidatus Kapabacteria bacterium]
MSAISLEIDSELIKEFVETKSNRAANEFVRTYRKFVYSVALRYVESYDDADDIAQEVFIKALDSIHKFKGGSSYKTWLYRITVNMALNFKRKKKLLNIFSFGSDNDEYSSEVNLPDRTLEDKEFEENFLKILTKLPEKQRETFALRYFDNLSYEEISNLLGTSIGGLKANYHQAVKKISQMIKIDESRGHNDES